MSEPVTDLVSELEQRGWHRYRDPHSSDVIALSGPRIDGPACSQNERPPAVHVRLHDFPVPGRGRYQSAEFHVCGEAGERWLNANIYSFSLGDVVANLELVQRVAAAVWRAYVEEMVKP